MSRLALVVVVVAAAAFSGGCPPDKDADDDGIEDEVEDKDGDGKVDIGETDPNDPDTDDDGLCDGNASVEGVCVAGEDKNGNGEIDDGETDPRIKDSDGDGFVDGDDAAPADPCIPLEEQRSCRQCVVGDFVISDTDCAVDSDCGDDVCLGASASAGGKCAQRPTGEADIQLVTRNGDGTSGFRDLADGGDVDLILPPQGGKALMIGVRAKNVTCNLLFSGGMKDSCQDPARFVATEGRAVVVADDDGDGFGTPVNPDELTNYLNLDSCPSVASSRDIDSETFDFELRVTEQPRTGESETRTHVIDTTIVPKCFEDDPDCLCECDADYNSDVETHPKSEQCPTINDNDVPGCPAAPGP